MPNPLAHFLPVDDRADGVYITVAREKKGSFSCGALFDAIDKAEVTNYDRAKIEETINRARGAPEKIGPPFEYYNKIVEGFVRITITDTGAVMKIDPAFIAANAPLSPTMVLYCIKQSGVRFGLIEENVHRALEERIFGTDVTVARDKAPEDGKDALIKFEINLKATLAPESRRDGSVDFREVHTFAQAKEGQVVARKIPATSGEPGRKVTGEIIPCKPGRDCTLPQGKNTVISEDGLSLLAAKTGQIKSDGSGISIIEQLIIPKDFDFSIGNVKFSGDLIIKGNVKPGFVVEAEGNIEIEGIVESANIKSRNGSVTVKKGVLGKSDAFIYAKTSIDVLFAQEANLETDGFIRIERHCLHCDCVCAVCDASKPNSSIVGGRIRASNYVLAAQIGNPNGIDTKIVLFDTKKGEAQEKRKEYEALKDKILIALEPVKKQVSAKAAIFKKAGELVSDRQKAEMKKWVDSYNVLNMKLKYIQDKIDSITKMIESPTNYEGYIKVINALFQGAILEMYGKRKVLEHTMHAKTFRIGSDGEIKTEG